MSIYAKIVGNLTADPLKKTVKVGGEPRTIVEIRVFSDEYKKVGDELVQEDDRCVGIDVTIWNERLGERVFKHLRKGARVRVEGDMVLRRFEDQDTNEQRAALQLTADTVDLVLARLDEVKFTPSRAQREASGQYDGQAA